MGSAMMHNTAEKIIENRDGLYKMINDHFTDCCHDHWEVCKFCEPNWFDEDGKIKPLSEIFEVESDPWAIDARVPIAAAIKDILRLQGVVAELLVEIERHNKFSVGFWDAKGE
jgi:hypothetical protein